MDRSSYSIGRLRAPVHDGELLAVPALQDCLQIALTNASSLAEADIQFGGRSLGGFRQWTRSVLLEKARNYLDSLHPDFVMAGPVLDAPLIVTGHQPVLAHPGVWAKNLATSVLSRFSKGTGLNLIVDNDSSGRMSLDVPGGTREAPRFHAIEFDRPGPERPWEEIEIQDETVFRGFANRVTEALAPWNLKAELTEVWPVIIERSQSEQRLATLLTLTRLQMEWKRGCQNLELPVSLLCDTDPFRSFVVEIACDAERFRQSYNESLAEYRREYKLHSLRHPVPDLELRDGRIELPFWVWKAGDLQRQRLYLKRSGNLIQLSDEQEVIGELNCPVGQERLARNDVSSAVEQLARLQNTWKIRPRALTLTLFSRLALADLFIHGIGGAKYDEVTDRIITKFYQVAPPAYSVVTATMHLPQVDLPVTGEQVQLLRHQLRDMRYNPQAYLPADEVAELIAERDELLKAKSLSRTETRESLRERHRELVRIRDQLFERLQPQRVQLQDQLRELELQLAATRVLKFREFATVLFSSSRLDELWNRIQQMVEPRVSTEN